MSKRHWLMDEIYFGSLNNSRPHYDICDYCEIGDNCHDCNRAAQEIADSLALDGSGHYMADYVVKYNLLDCWAKINVSLERES